MVYFIGCHQHIHGLDQPENLPSAKKHWRSFFAALGLAYFFEVFLMLVTNAYVYYPKIATDRFHESLIGNFFSSYSVSASAVLLAAFGLNIRWQIGFSIAYIITGMADRALCDKK
jgi:hypothetical protein